MTQNAGIFEYIAMIVNKETHAAVIAICKDYEPRLYIDTADNIRSSITANLTAKFVQEVMVSMPIDARNELIDETFAANKLELCPLVVCSMKGDPYRFVNTFAEFITESVLWMVYHTVEESHDGYGEGEDLTDEMQRQADAMGVRRI